MMNNKKIKYILFLLILLILISTVSLVVKSTREKQEIRKRAATPTGAATFSLEPQTLTVSPGQSLPVTIKFHTPTTPNNKGIVGIAAVLSYSFSGNNPLALNPENIQGKLSSPWNYVIKNVVTEGNTVTIQINAVYLQSGETGYTEARTPKEFATLNFTAQNEGNVTLSFNAEESKILAKDPINEDILSSNLPTGTYTVTEEEATPTPTPTIPPTPTLEPEERCQLSPEKQNYVIGEQAVIYVSQNPKFNNNDACYYREMDVKENDQTICRASGFGVNARTQPCIWNTSGATPGEHRLVAVYGGHSDNSGVVPTPPGRCNPNIPCCDGGYNCYTTVTLSTPTPTPTPRPTFTPTPTLTPTPAPTETPGQVKIQVKIKFKGIDRQVDQQWNNQQIKILLRNKNNPTKSQDIVSKTVTGDNQGIFQTEMFNLSSNITPGAGYYLLIKGPKHLQVRYCKNSGQNRPCSTSAADITLQNGENVLDFTTFPLPPGDLPHPTYGQDGVVNAVDAVYLTRCMEMDSPSDECLANADLNLDGILNNFDVGLLNWTIFTRYEDREDE